MFPAQILEKKLFKSQTSCFLHRFWGKKYSNFKLHVSHTDFGRNSNLKFHVSSTDFGQKNSNLKFHISTTDFVKKIFKSLTSCSPHRFWGKSIQISNFMFPPQILEKKYSNLKLHVSPHRFWKNIQISKVMFPHGFWTKKY